jgi:CRISPR-associated endonuclease Csn1
MIIAEVDGVMTVCKVVKLSAGIITLTPHHEANTDSRNRDKDDPFKYTYCAGDALRKRKARKLFVDPLGKIRGYPAEDD